MSVSCLVFKRSIKKSWGRFLLTVLAVGLGFAVILTFTAATNALVARQGHSVWQGFEQTPVDGIDPLLLELVPEGNLDKWRNLPISVTAIRATGDTSPQITGLSTPGAGEYYVSEALAEIMRSHSDENIGARFGEVNRGIIPKEFTGSPDELAVIRGMSEAETLRKESVANVYGFNDNPEAPSFDGLMGFILLFGGIILLFPIVLFLITSTQLGAAQREVRYAAMRLVGATQPQVARVQLFESFVAAAGGILLGLALYLAVRTPMSQFHFEGKRFWPEDIIVQPAQFALLGALVIVLSIGASWWGMRRVKTSPLRVSRSQSVQSKPRLWKVVPLATGLAIYGFIATPWGEELLGSALSQSSAPLLVLIGGLLLVMLGLVWAGPWLVSRVSAVFSRRTQNAKVLIATKRIERNASLILRSVSGVVLALFAGSFYLTAVSGVDSMDARAINNNGYSVINEGNATVVGASLPRDFQDVLADAPYVVSTAILYGTDEGHAVTCQNLTKYTKLLCPEGTQPEEYVQFNFENALQPVTRVSDEMRDSAKEDYLVQLTHNEAIDKLRSLVATSANEGSAPGYVVSGTYAKDAITDPIVKELAGLAITDPIVKELAGLAYLGIAVTVLVAIASLIVSTIGSLYERKKSFAMLRLSGMTVGQMKQIVMIEALFPLIAVSVAAAGIGIWVGVVFMSIVSTSAAPSLSWVYVAILLGSLLLAILAIYSTLPLMKVLTSYENNRGE